MIRAVGTIILVTFGNVSRNVMVQHVLLLLVIFIIFMVFFIFVFVMTTVKINLFRNKNKQCRFYKSCMNCNSVEGVIFKRINKCCKVADKTSDQFCHHFVCGGV